MLDEEFFEALGGVMLVLREISDTSEMVKEVICEEVLQRLSQEQVSERVASVEKMKFRLFDKAPAYLDLETAFDAFKEMLSERDFRVNDSLKEALGTLFERSVMPFRPLSPQDHDHLKWIKSELRKL